MRALGDYFRLRRDAGGKLFRVGRTRTESGLSRFPSAATGQVMERHPVDRQIDGLHIGRCAHRGRPIIDLNSRVAI